ncbi:MAG: hypothetical protein RLZZ342_254 [Candidatus Parcubacteria bacterium]|jgi:cellulose synthase/poly-beta-1,6-N-acetylglucosamine synthase-like glycosyltransferase
MFELMRSYQEMLETGQWPVFLVYALLMLVLISPRILLGAQFLWLEMRGCIRNYPHKKFAATAIVTVADEDPEVFEMGLRALARSLKRGTTAFSILVIIDRWNDPEIRETNIMLAAISRKHANVVLCTDALSKRPNLRELVRAARRKGILHDLLILVDSDTIPLDANVVEKLLRPFSDPRIGGTTTAQLVMKPKTWVQRASFWLEHARMLSSMAAASLFKQVLCLPGRMYAVRTKLIEDKMDELVNDSFRFLWWGPWQAKAGDDRFITNCVLKAGYGTVMVPEAIVMTTAPATFEATRLMWTRWGRSSQWYTLTSPWLLKPRNWFAAFIGWGDIFVTLSTMYIIFIHWPYSLLTGTRTGTWYEMLAYSLLGMALTFLSRQLGHLHRYPRDVFYLPAFMLMATLGQVFRFQALLTPNKIGKWGTRNVDTGGTPGAWELDEETVRVIECSLQKKGGSA